MIPKKIIEAVNRRGAVSTDIKYGPYDQIYLCPDIIYELADNKKVIHLSHTDNITAVDDRIDSGKHMRKQLSYVASKYLGIDDNEAAAAHLRDEHRINNIITRDIAESDISEILSEQWDFILLDEVLEYTDNPVSLLQSIKQNYGGNISKMIITVTNILNPAVFNNARKNIEAININNKYCFTPYTLCNTAYRAGLLLEDLYFAESDWEIGNIIKNSFLIKSMPLNAGQLVLTVNL